MAMMGVKRQRDLQGLASSLVRLARLKAGVSQAEMAARAGVPRSTVERIEAGTRQPSLVTLQRLLVAVDLELRTRLEPYDDHDDVLEATYAALDPQQREIADARNAARLAAFDAARLPTA